MRNLIAENRVPISIVSFCGSIGQLCGNLGHGIAAGILITLAATFICFVWKIK